jgi:tetratricopeptide (TPR) repeat protein
VLEQRSRFAVLAPPMLFFGPKINRAGALTDLFSAAIFRCSKFTSYLRQDWTRILLLAIIAGIVHAPALQGERIWDDQYLAHDNPLIKSPLLVLEAFRHYLFLDSFSAHYRPVQNISYIIDYFFWNTDTYGFHLTNVLLHAASGILLYLLLKELFVSLFLRRASITVRAYAQRRLPWISIAAFCVAVIWVVHPVHSAAVDYISGRADSLAFLFSCAGWLMFLRAQRLTRPVISSALYFLAAVSGLLALLSREITCIWIALFLAHLLFVERHVRFRTRIWAVACSSLIIAVYMGLRHLPEQQPSSSLNFRQSSAIRAVLMARALGDYGRLIIFPANLHMDRTVGFDQSYSHGNVGWRSAITTDSLSILGLLVLATLVYGSLKKGQGQTARIFGASWFLAAYLPISNIVQLNASVAEHWLYLPSVGFLIFLAGWAIEFPKRYRGVILACTWFAVISLSVRSFVRSSDWISEETFYERTLAAGGTSTRVAANLGHIYANHGNYSAAENMYRRILQIAPGYPVALNNLADVLLRQGKRAEAEAVFKAAVVTAAKTPTEDPRTWLAAVNYAYLRHKANDDKAALSLLENARATYPNVWEIISYESELLRETKGPAAALPLVADFGRGNWWHYGAALALGRLYAEKGDVDLAETALRHASRLDVHDVEALNLIASMRMRQNRFEDACRIQRQAISRQPDQPRQYLLLSNILDKMGRGDEARTALAQVSRLRALAKSQPVAN